MFDDHTAEEGSEAAPEGPAVDATGLAARIMALDVGNRRIGLALTDALGITAQPLLTIWRTAPRADLKSIVRLIRKYEVREIVIGLPLHSSGELSAQARKTQAFAATLVASLPTIKVHWIDERLTTVEAHALLDQTRGRRAGKEDRQQRSAIIDQVAAVLLLEAFLSMRAPRLLPPDFPDEP